MFEEGSVSLGTWLVRRKHWSLISHCCLMFYITTTDFHYISPEEVMFESNINLQDFSEDRFALKQISHSSPSHTSKWCRNSTVCRTNECEWVSLRLSDLRTVSHLFLVETCVLFRLGVNILPRWFYRKCTVEAERCSKLVFSWLSNPCPLTTCDCASSVAGCQICQEQPAVISKASPPTLADTKSQRKSLYSDIWQRFLIKPPGANTGIWLLGSLFSADHTPCVFNNHTQPCRWKERKVTIQIKRELHLERGTNKG